MSGKVSITEGKGFQITFPNGVMVSVQFGAGNYSSNSGDPGLSYGTRRSMTAAEYQNTIPVESPDAEIAIIGKDCWLTRDWRRGLGDDVMGYATPKDILSALNWAARQRREG